jgi:uncharacterized membrane protein
MHWKTISHYFFALTILAIGIIGLATGGFAPILAGVPKSLPDRQLVAYVCDFLLLACGAGLLVRRTAAPAALALLIYLIIWTLLFKVPFIIRQPLVEVSYQTTGENAVLIAGAWVLYVAIAAEAKQRFRFAAGDPGLRIAHVLYGLALIAFGFSHFAYLSLTAPIIPSWIPGHVFWAYFTGTAYVAAGVAILSGILARLAALLVALQIGLITLLVWGPVVLSGHMSAMDGQETVVSWALTAAAFVLATSFGRRPWLSRLGVGLFVGKRLARG